MSSSFELRPITPTIGAEILAVNIADALSDAALLHELRDAFLAHHVLVFRDQHISDDEHKAFGREFGDLHVHPSRRGENFQGDREIFEVHADHDTVLNNGGLWHADVTCDVTPPLGSMLLLTEAPPIGGDTLFANMHLAYETLSEPIKTLLGELTAEHDQRLDVARYGYEIRPDHPYPVATHPVVVAHPDTGRPLLYVNRAFTRHINELTTRESDALLALLHDHVATNPTLQCRVSWQPGTLVFWDNRCTQHFAVWDYRPARRSGRRVTIAAAEAPAAVASTR